MNGVSLLLFLKGNSHKKRKGINFESRLAIFDLGCWKLKKKQLCMKIFQEQENRDLQKNFKNRMSKKIEWYKIFGKLKRAVNMDFLKLIRI